MIKYGIHYMTQTMGHVQILSAVGYHSVLPPEVVIWTWYGWRFLV